MRADQACPICSAHSECWLEDFANKHHFFCETCGEFEVTRKAKELLLESPTRRATALEQILKAPPKSFARLTYDFSSNSIALEYLPKNCEDS